MESGTGGEWVAWDIVATAYCPCAKCCGKYADGITASGVPAEGKLIAAPKSVAFGTLIFVPGYGLAPVEDRGRAIRGDRLDLLFPTHAAAKRFGRRKVTVQVWKPNAKGQPSPSVAKTPLPKAATPKRSSPVPKRPIETERPRSEPTPHRTPRTNDRDRVRFGRSYELAEHDDLPAFVDRMVRDHFGRGALPGWLKDQWARVLIPPGYIARVEIRHEVWMR